MSDDLWERAQRLFSRLQRHRERYIRAYCARYGIPPERLDEYELVQQERWSYETGTHETTTFMRRRTG